MSHRAILVGRRPDFGWRDRLWAYCRSYWERELGWPIYEGRHGPSDRDEFCLAVASNRAAEFGGWNVAVYTGADWLPRRIEQVHQAVALAEQTDQLVFVHDRAIRLDEGRTEKLLEGQHIERIGLEYADSMPNTFSGILAVTRTLWNEVGGFDERFVGWGGEDLAFWSACWAFAGGFERIAGDIVHLWHPEDEAIRHRGSHHNANESLMLRYIEARCNRHGMNEILYEPGAPLDRRQRGLLS